MTNSFQSSHFVFFFEIGFIHPNISTKALNTEIQHQILTSFEMSITPLIVLLTSCLPAICVLNNLPISSIFAFAAIFLALSVRFLNMICLGSEIIRYFHELMNFSKGTYCFISYWWQYDGLLHDSHHNFPQLLQQPLENGFLAGLCIHGQRTIQ